MSHCLALHDCSRPGFAVHHHLVEFAQTHVLWVNDVIKPSHPMLPLFPPSLRLSQHQGLFHWVGSSHQVAKVLELSFSISPSSEQSWFPLGLTEPLAVQGTLKSLLQHHSLKASVLWCSAFLMVQLSCPDMTIGKTTALTIRTLSPVMSLLFNMLSRFVTAFLPRSKHLLISWLQSPSAMILVQKIKMSTQVGSSIQQVLPVGF